MCKYMSSKGLISNIYKQLIQQNKKLIIKQKSWTVNSFPKKTCRWPTGTEKYVNIANDQENTNKNHNEISRQTCQNDYYQNEHK